MSVNITVSGRRRGGRTGKRPASHSMPATGSIEASIVRYDPPEVRNVKSLRDFTLGPGGVLEDAG